MMEAENLFNSKAIEEIRNLLLEKHETISMAESVTSGLMQAAFSTAPDASKFYQGGITAYNIGQKCRHLFVEPIHAESCDCVSEKVADEMAINVCKLFISDWGIGITGYAIPVPESEQKIFAHYSIACKNKIVLQKKIIAKKEEALRVQLFFVNAVLEDLAILLREKQMAHT